MITDIQVFENECGCVKRDRNEMGKEKRRGGRM